MKKPALLVIYTCLSMSACLASQYFCADGMERIIFKAFETCLNTASAIITGADRLASLAFGIFLYGASRDAGYDIKYFCGICLVTEFICRVCILGGAPGFLCALWTGIFLVFFSVILNFMINFRTLFCVSAIPSAASVIFFAMLRF